MGYLQVAEKKSFSRREIRTIIRNSFSRIECIRIFLFDLFKRLIGVQGEESFGKSGISETHRSNWQGGSPAARGKRSLARISTAVS